MREPIPAGDPVTAPHGIGFMDTATGDIDFLRFDPGQRGVAHSYMASPGNRFVSAWGQAAVGGSGPRGGIFDRRTGASWAVPYDQFFVEHLEDDFVVVRAVVAANDKNREPGSLFFVLDEAMREIARFEGASQGYNFLRDRRGGLLFAVGEDGVREINLRSGAVRHVHTLDDISRAVEKGGDLAVAGAYVREDALYVTFFAANRARTAAAAHLVPLPIVDMTRAWQSRAVRFLGHVPPEPGSAMPLGQVTGTPELSPDSRNLLVAGSYRSGQTREGPAEKWAYADILSATGATPVMRARSAWLGYGDAHANRHWLADSSGFVAEIQEADAPTDTTSGWREAGRSFGIIRLDGSVEFLPRSIREERFGIFFGSSPIPSPDNPDLFSLGRSAVFNAATGEIIEVQLQSMSPGHLDPWGDTSEEMRFSLPHHGHGLVTAGTLLPVDVEEPPFGDQVRFVTARSGTCVNVRGEPSVESEVLGCLPDGVHCTLDPAALMPETARRPGSDEATAFHWEGEQAFVHVRTEYGHRGWIAMQFLDWA